MKTKRLLTKIAYVTLTAASLTAPQPLLADGWGQIAHFLATGYPQYGEWLMTNHLTQAYPGNHLALNTAALDGCPGISTDGRTLYFASNRAGGLGGTDIWVSRRNSVYHPWGEPANLGEPINSAQNDFCPTPVGSHGLLFVSGRPDGCGGSDMYFAREERPSGWTEPLNLGCEVNSSGDEFSPSLVEYFGPGQPWSRTMELYFSSRRPGGFAPEAEGQSIDADIYFATFRADGSLGPPELVPGVNTASDDMRPNLRADGLELFFDSNRPGGLGGFDIWVSSRNSVRDEWETPVNLGPIVNTSAGEARSFLSGDGTELYFGSNRAGGLGSDDLYVAIRERHRTQR